MKKVLSVCLLAVFAIGIVFAAGSDTKVTVDLSKKTSSSSLVSVKEKSSNLQITYEGSQNITVELTGKIDGTVIVESSTDITLSLNNVTITGNELPAMQLKSEVNYTLSLPKGSESTLSDSSNNGKKGAVTTGGNIIIEGSGKLTLNVYKKHGFKTDGGLTINSGNVVINGDSNAEGNMISADTFFVMNGGSLTIVANGDVEASESKGIKVNGVEGKDFECGYIEINGGTIDITSTAKAITAGWKAEDDATTETTDDDPVPDVFINGGTITIKTTLEPREDTYTDGVSNDDGVSPEGIEAKHNLYLNGGTVTVYSTDDCVNAGNDIYVTGGYYYLASSSNDSFDANGKICISGGTLITYSKSMEQAFDCDNDSNFTYTGGTFVGLGNGNNVPKGEGTTCCSIAVGSSTFSAGEHVAVLNSKNKVVIGFVIPEDVSRLSCIVFGSENIKKGETYTVAKGKFSKTTSDGLITSSVSFTSSSTLGTFTMSDYSASSGYIGMNVGGDGDFGMMGMGGFDADATLPDKVIITEDLTAEEAQQAISYIMSKYMGGQMGDMEKPDDMPDMSNMTDMQNMTPPDGNFGGFGGGQQGGQIPAGGFGGRR